MPHSMGRHHLQYCAAAVMETRHVWMMVLPRSYWGVDLEGSIGVLDSGFSLPLHCFVIFACKCPKSCRWSPVVERAQSGNWQWPLLLGQSTSMWWASTQRFLAAKFHWAWKLPA